jgi:hypothetical protein
MANGYTDEINRFLLDYTAKNGGVNNCRHGGCIELTEDFISSHNGAEGWETWELEPKYNNYPLKLSTTDIKSICASEKTDDLFEIGIFGTHAVIIWHGYVFDAAGISTLEAITTYFGGEATTHWIRTMWLCQ